MSSSDGVGRSAWASVTIGQTGHVRLGVSRSPARVQSAERTPYIRAANIGQGELKLDDVFEMEFSASEQVRYALRPGDVVLAEASGSVDQVGRAAVWNGEIENCCFQNTVIRYRPWSTLPDYAALLFRHMQAVGIFAEASRGSGLRHLAASRFAQIQFSLPPLTEQARITADAKHRLQSTVAARSSLESALKKNATRITEILTLASNGQIVNADVTDWNYKRVVDVGEVLLGPRRTPDRSYGSHMRPYLRVANVQEGWIDTSDVHEMNFDPDEFNAYRLEVGDILLNEGQSPELVGRAAMFNNEVPEACFQNTLLRFRANEQLRPEFALLAFRGFLRQGKFKAIAKWSTSIAHLTRRRFVEMIIPVPPIDIQDQIVAEAQAQLLAAEADDVRIRRAAVQLDVLERETLALAVSGQLLPPGEIDETAHELLARLGPPMEQLDNEDVDISERKTDVPVERSAQRGSLQSIVRDAGRGVALPELFRLAGYDRNSISDIEDFYLELRSELARGSIVGTENAAENDMIETRAVANP